MLDFESEPSQRCFMDSYTVLSICGQITVTVKDKQSNYQTLDSNICPDVYRSLLFDKQSLLIVDSLLELTIFTIDVIVTYGQRDVMVTSNCQAKFQVQRYLSFVYQKVYKISHLIMSSLNLQFDWPASYGRNCPVPLQWRSRFITCN